MSGAPAPERRLSKRALLAFGTVTAAMVVLLHDAGMTWLDAGTLGFILVLMPILAVAQVRLLGDVEIERLPVYVSSFVTLVVLGAVCGAVGWAGWGLEALGIGAVALGPLLAWSAGLTAGGLLILFAFRQMAEALGLREAPIVEALVPRTRRERRAFVGLSTAAGLGEEVAYRGYGIAVLAPLLGAGGAAVLTSAVFGVLHAYQGPRGMVRAGLLGGLLAWGLLESGSLWPPIVAHALLDVLAGIVFADRLMGRGGGTGVQADT